METPKNPLSITYRIREAISRLAGVLRIDEWNRSKLTGLSPTQLSILDLLEGRDRSGLAVKEIAARLGVSQPTATDSINALERKGHVVKRSHMQDRRGVNIGITEPGLALLEAGGLSGSVVEEAVSALDAQEQAVLLLSLVKMIRHLQEKGAIPVQRMCVTCRHFAPFAHADPAQPHHCHFVDSPFGQREIRVDCRDHEITDPASRAATWEAFSKGYPNPPGR